MSKLIKRFLTAFVVLAALTLVSCQTVRESPAGRRLMDRPGEFREAVPVVMVDDQGVGGLVEYLPPDELLEMYGRGPENPFVAPRAVLTPIEFVVFRITFTSLEAATSIDIRDTEFRFSGNTETPAPPNTLIRFWENHEDNKELRGHERSRRDNLIRSELFGHDVQAGDEPVSGLLVFIGRFADYGPAELRIPLIDDDGRMIEQVVVEMELDG